MNNFEKRRDRFELFESMENPLLNLTFNLEVTDFRPFCKVNELPPFHFFLFHLFKSLMKVDNFRYRIYKNEVIKIDRLIPSYTVMNEDQVLNFTRFEHSEELKEFIERSLKAKEESTKSRMLLHSAEEFTEREIKDYVFITSIPWLDFTSIQHPVKKYKSADIPSIAWGKFKSLDNGRLTMPFSVQAHHGFVDGFHIHQLAEAIAHSIDQTILFGEK
ncbi:MAG: CatA-like O-acetyltransferase [Bacteriovoracaceae bacterium]|nr:CatA-like O-acetyltransferase [Bacteriovoracaceae bacterium]